MIEYKFGMKGNQRAPEKCPDCGCYMSHPVYKDQWDESHYKVSRAFIVGCLGGCGCYFQWEDPWTKHHRLPLFELALHPKKEPLTKHDNRASSR